MNEKTVIILFVSKLYELLKMGIYEDAERVVYPWKSHLRYRQKFKPI